MLISHYTSLGLSVPRLAILALDNLFVHEWYDEQRTLPLQERIRASGIFSNPPIVSPMQDSSDHYIVLDGANRTAALRAMQFPHILAQIVDSNDPGLRLRTWNHALLDITLKTLLEKLHEVPDLDLISSDEPVIELPGKREIGIALLQIPDGKIYSLSAPASDLLGRVATLNAVADVYKRYARLERTALNDIRQVAPLYNGLIGLMIYPKFNLDDLTVIVKANRLLPPGITRTTVSPRALSVNIPLDDLKSPLPLEAKNRRLQEILNQRIEQGKVEIYAESTYIFNE